MFVGGFIRESSNVTWFLSEYRVDSGSLQRKHGESSISPAITINWMNIRPTFAVAVAQKNSWIIEMFSRFLISSESVIRNSKEPSTSSTFTSCAMLATAPTWRAAWNAGSAARAAGDPEAFHAMARCAWRAWRAWPRLLLHGLAPVGVIFSQFFSWNPPVLLGILVEKNGLNPNGRPSSKVVSLASFPWPCREVVWDMWLGVQLEGRWRDHRDWDVVALKRYPLVKPQFANWKITIFNRRKFRS